MALPLGPFPEPCDLKRDVKQILAEDIRACQLSRAEIAFRLGALTGRNVSLAQLDAMVALSKEHRFPAEWLAAWTVITGSRRLLDLICRVAGYCLADETDQELAEFARLQLEQKRASARAETLRKRLAERL